MPYSRLPPCTVLAVGEFQEKPVPESLVRHIVEAGHLTASSRNGQPWHFVLVRDRGPGFDLDTVATDRMGIRESIVGRMQRYGGQASIRTAPGEGTEVRIEWRRD